MLMSKNVNNDVSKDSPIREVDHLIEAKLFSNIREPKQGRRRRQREYHLKI